MPPPVSEQSAAQRGVWLSDSWLPFVSSLRAQLARTLERTVALHSPARRLPSQHDMAALATRCRLLTRQWYGGDEEGGEEGAEEGASLSALYAWLVEASDAAGQSPYRFEEVPQRRSRDGWLRLVDGNVRRRLYGKDAASKEEEEEGDVFAVDHHVGVSPLDNTVLPNVVAPGDARLLLAGGHARRLAVVQLARRQRKALALLGMQQLPSQAVKARLEEMQTHGEGRRALEAAGVRAASPSFAVLLATGRPIEDYAQLGKAARAGFDALVKERLLHASGEETHAAHEGQLADFLRFLKEHPGEYYGGDKGKHRTLLFAGLLSRDLNLLSRTAVESFTEHRYLVHSWTRRHELVYVGDESDSIKTLRGSNVGEHSRFRKNTFPYAHMHGLGISSGGLVEHADLSEDEVAMLGEEDLGVDVDEAAAGLPRASARRDMGYELGNALPRDPSARLPNWFVTDIEKVVAEAAVLNPPLAPPHTLPGEESFCVAQNPRCGSSIGVTQHTQIERGTAADFPVFALENCPMALEGGRGATIDLVQLGQHPDAFMVKIVAPLRPPPVCTRVLVDIRQHLLSAFGHEVDFVFHAVPSAAADALILSLTPIAPTATGATPLDACNTDTMRTARQDRVPTSSLDAATGKGTFLLTEPEQWEFVEDGRACLERMYDHCRKLGSRRIVRQVVMRTCGYIDREVAARLPAAPLPQPRPRDPIFSVLHKEALAVAHHIDDLVPPGEAPGPSGQPA